MCIFSGSHPDVSKTRILVAWVGRHTQLTVYQNDVKLASGKDSAAAGTAMILPIPGGNVRMVDLSRYPTLFDDIKRDFPDPVSRGIQTKGRGGKAAPTLDIQRVGSYDVSLAATLNELKQLDWSHFVLDADVVRLLEHDYGRGFAFCVARLRPDSAGSPHALAYVHDNASGHLFVPTRHAGHESQPAPKVKRSKTQSGRQTVQWDHLIYVYAGSESGYNTVRGSELTLKKNIIAGALPDGCALPVAETTCLRNFAVHGDAPNADTWIVHPDGEWAMSHEDLRVR